MEDLKNAVEYLKLKPEGKLNNPAVLMRLAKKLGIKTDRQVRGRLLLSTGKVWVRTIQAEIIEKATLVRRNKEKKQQQQIKRIDKKQPLKRSVKLVDRVGQFSKYQIAFPNNDNSLEALYNELQEFISSNDFDNAFLVLIFRTRGTNRLRFVSVRPSDYEAFEDLQTFVGELVSGDAVGTDKVSVEEEDLLLNVFGVNAFSSVGFGDKACMLWETEDIISKGNCADKCLEFCGYKTEKVKDLGILLKIIKDKYLPIRVVKNNPSFDYSTFKEKASELEYETTTIEHFNKKIVKIKKAYFKNELDYEPTIIQDCEEFKYTIIFCENGRHFSVAKNNTMILADNVFIDLTEKVIGNDEVGMLYKFQQFNYYNTPTKKLINTCEFKYVFFDLETIIDWDYANCMKPYSLSICCLDEIQLEQLEKYDKEKNVKACESMRERFCKTWIGYDCVRKFLEWVVDNQADKKFKFVGFNNANFDNFFILQELMKGYGVGDLFIELKESNIFFSGSSLMNFTINGRHSFFDLRKHLIGSLDNNCKSWGVNCCAKLSFNHNDAQNLYDNDPQSLIDYCLNDNTLKKYNEYDTISVAVILQKYKKELYSIPCVKAVFENDSEYASFENKGILDITTIGTIGSLIYKVFTNECEKNEIKFGQLDMFKYNELQRCKIAGRVELFNGVQHIKEKCASIDACSLYPYVLAVKDVYYPSGEIEEVDSFKGYDTIGFYWVSFNQEDLEGKNLPNIYALKTGIRNEWDYKGEIKQYLLSNVILKLLNDSGVDYVFDSPVDYAGFIFEKEHKSCEMFRFLLEIMKNKNQQDGYKASKTEKHLYNSALRETLKLLMNAISGKVIEGLHTEQTEIMSSDQLAILFQSIAPSEEESDIKHKIKSVNMINNYGGKLVVQYEYFDIYKLAQQRPIYLGVLLYDYAKDYMYRETYSKVGLENLLYTDTDSCKMRYNHFEEWCVEASKKIVPHWKEVEAYDDRYATHPIYSHNSKVFGSFEDELEDYNGEGYEFFCLEKKCWLYRYGDNVDFRFKGINQRAIHMDMKEPPLWVEEVKRLNSKTLEKEIGYRVNQSLSKEVNAYYHNHLSECLVDMNAYNLFKTLHTERSAYVLTSNFRKIVNNQSQSINEDGEIIFNNANCLSHQVQMNYMLKKIQL